MGGVDLSYLRDKDSYIFTVPARVGGVDLSILPSIVNWPHFTSPPVWAGWI